MRKFELYNPIRMIFGVGEFERLGELASEYGKKPLVVFGGEFAREAGLVDRAVELLKAADMDPVVFEGVEPNARLGTCRRGARIASENECDMVIGIGGGSVMDASKVLAFGFYDPDGIWKHIAHWEPDYEEFEEALPIVLVSTLAATGSEGDGGAVITNEETKDKVGVFGEALFPRVSIIDPELTLTVPTDYTRDGAVDMSIHVLESYFNGDQTAKFSDRCTEGFFAEVIEALEAVMDDPEDIEARSQLSWLGAISLQGFINQPRGGPFPLHAMEHPLSGYFDISHGRGLALLLPRWLKYVSREKPDKIIQFGDRVFTMELESHHPFEAADKVIGRFIEWLEDIGAWFFMDSLGIPNDPVIFRKMAEDVVRMYGKDGYLGGLKPLSVDDIVAIYEMCVRTGAPEDKAFGEERSKKKAALDEEGEEIVEIVEEVIELGEGEELPEGLEKEGYSIVEEIPEDDRAD